MRDDIVALIDEGEGPLPVRFWWLKRLAVGFILFVVAVFGLKTVAERAGQRRLDAEIAALRAKGEPILPEDFAEPAVAEAENAAAYLKRAGRLFDLSSKDKDDDATLGLLLGRKLPFSGAEMLLLDRLLQHNCEVLGLIRQARSKSGVNWAVYLESPAANVSFLHLNDTRALTRLLMLAALHAHQRGDDPAAIEYLRDVMAISRMLHREPSLISHIMNCMDARLTAATIEQIAPALKPPNVEQMRALLADLLDERLAREGFVRAFQAERMHHIALRQGPGAGRSLLGEGFRPLFMKELSILLAYDSEVIEAARQRDLPAAMAKLPPPPSPGAPRLLVTTGLPSWIFPIGSQHQLRKAQREAAIALAARMYELEHGRRPGRVEDLVPGYLPEVLEDPVAGNGAKLGLPAGKGSGMQ